MTGVGGQPVKGSQYAAEKRPYNPRRRGGGYFGRGSVRRDNRRSRFPRRDFKEEPGFESAQDSGVEKHDQEVAERPRRVNRQRGGFFRRGGYYPSRPRRGMPRRPRGLSNENYVNDEQAEPADNSYSGERPQGAPDAQRPRQKRFLRRYWSRRPRRPRSDTEGSQSGADGDASGVSYAFCSFFQIS